MPGGFQMRAMMDFAQCVCAPSSPRFKEITCGGWLTPRNR